MKYSSRPIMAALSTLLLGLAGCSHDQFPAYSISLKYPLRQDPILMQPAAKLGDERYDPDMPGLLPIMTFDDILKPAHVRFLDYEVEIDLVIGRELPVGTQVTEENWTSFVAGAVVTNDVSARDIQLPKTQFFDLRAG